MALPSPDFKAFGCPSCEKTFGRAEHLRRHRLIHNENRPFSCRFCPKAFIRRDALQRHELTHQQPTPNLLQRGGRACSQCAAAKARCSGDTQCTRCRDRKVACVYPTNAPNDEVGHVQQGEIIVSPANCAFSGPSPGFQPAPILNNASLGVETPSIMDYDFWHQSILSSTDWLGAIDEAGFSGYPLSQFPVGQDPLYPLQSALDASSAQPAVLHAHLGQGHSGSPRSIVSAPSTNATGSYMSEHSQDNDAGETGAYYVDGQPARLPRIKRRRTSASTHNDHPRTDAVFSLRLPDFVENRRTCSFTVDHGCFTGLQEMHVHLCINPPPGWLPFEPVELPNQEVINHLLALYMTHFDQTLPFLHTADSQDVGKDQNLILAMATIGSQYLDCAGSSLFKSSLHEYLRRSMFFRQATIVLPKSFDLCHAGAELLQIVAFAYSGNEHLIDYARGLFTRVTDVFEGARSMALALEITAKQGAAANRWYQWQRRERFIRLAYSAWLVDCMSQYHFDQRQMLNLKDANLPLPSDERQWRAQTEQDWRSLGETHPQPCLSQALNQLYVDKKLPRDRGEFARILIIHGLYHRLWEVARYSSNPLSHWEPTARRQSSSELLPQEPIWLPGVPSFMKWQNSACDCLDVLHWQANATIGQASGLEHPTVLHLHLARIVLLTPYAEIVRLARAMSRRGASASFPTFASDRQLVQRWAVQHQFKARLAIIHAGAVFWHVRRYSIDAYYEASAVALAALILWAFGMFATKQDLSRQEPQASLSSPSKAAQEGQQLSNNVEQGDDAVCGIILLDRPADDEIVQQFIRTGHNMKAHITGVGDLYSSRGPERVLAQGCKLLSMLNSWGVSGSWLKLLTGLIEATRKGTGG